MQFDTASQNQIYQVKPMRRLFSNKPGTTFNENLPTTTINVRKDCTEEGFAAGMGKEIIQTCENTTDLAFDINHNNTYSYANAHQLEEQLVDSFNEICKRLLS